MLRLAAAALAIVLGLASPRTVISDEPRERLTSVIEAVKSEIAEAQEDSTGEGVLLVIDRVVLSLQLFRSSSTQADAGPSFEVAGLSVSGRGGVAQVREESTLLLLEMHPEEDVLVRSRKELGLAQAIKELKEAVKTAMATEPVMKLKQAQIDLEFLTKKDADGVLEFVVVSTQAAEQRKHAHRIQVFLSVADF